MSDYENKNSNRQAFLSLLLLVCSMTLLWDGFTTLYGTQKIFGANPQAAGIAIIASILLGLLIVIVMVVTPLALKTEGTPVSVKVILIPLYPTAVVYDFYTSYIGNLDLIFQGTADSQQQFLLIGLTGFVSSSSIILSLLLPNLRR
jgi:hypothetical protein